MVRIENGHLQRLFDPDRWLNGLEKYLGPSNRGRAEYFLSPKLRESWGGPFNGQQVRRQIFWEILELASPKAIVETGTYRGTTAEFLASAGMPLFTVELDPRFHAYSALRLRALKNVRLKLGDSRPFLRELSQDPVVPRDGVFFYLDAHWYQELPLAEELKAILSHWRSSIVMIDDFAVPGDDTYGFDRHSSGLCLDIDYLESSISRRLDLFFPLAPSHQETGARRGCVVLGSDAQATAILKNVRSLREHNPAKQ